MSKRWDFAQGKSAGFLKRLIEVSLGIGSFLLELFHRLFRYRCRLGRHIRVRRPMGVQRLDDQLAVSAGQPEAKLLLIGRVNAQQHPIFLGGVTHLKLLDRAHGPEYKATIWPVLYQYFLILVNISKFFDIPSNTIDLNALSSYCKAAADPLRLQILRVLSRESFGVLELCGILGTAQSALSHHLKILSNAELVETRREGTSIYYRRALIHEDDPLKSLRTCLFEAVDDTELDPELASGISLVHDNRHEQARTFFKRNADRFQDDQNLIAHYEQYAECLEGVLGNEQLNTRCQVIEIGPGESDLILYLADHFNHILAIDNNREMLDKTRNKATGAKRSNISYFEGELHQSDQVSDLLVLNMVLHHIASPARLFQEARLNLRPGGTLLVADLCSHDQAWTREACGDLWLGFNTEEMDSWATAAGFNIGHSQYLGLKNGFQVLVKTYKSTPEGELHD